MPQLLNCLQSATEKLDMPQLFTTLPQKKKTRHATTLDLPAICHRKTRQAWCVVKETAPLVYMSALSHEQTELSTPNDANVQVRFNNSN